MRPSAWSFAAACMATPACQSERPTEGQDPPPPSDTADTDPTSAPEPPTTSLATSLATEASTSHASDTDTAGPVDTTATDPPHTGTGTGDETTTTTTPAGCGDGVLDPGEACDLGYMHNNDAGPCTQACHSAVCGDGLLWADHEQCDHGVANNDQTYNGCREDCTPGPRCGDGVLQPNAEECDESAPLDDDSIVECSACRFNARLAFVTAASHPAKLGGLAGADALCVAAATAAGLDRASSFLAWLSDGVASPSQRFEKAIADPATPYARRDGQLLAGNFKLLTTLGIQTTLDVDEFGATLPPKTYVWTATNPNGLPYNGDACGMWTLDSFKLKARAGLTSPSLEEGAFDLWKAGDNWTSYEFLPCKMDDLHLYCFED